MKNSPLHQSPEERLASNTAQTVEAIQGNTQEVVKSTEAIKGLHDSIKDKSVEMDGFTAVINTIKKVGQAIKDPQPEKVVKKLEEIKSAALISNKFLKDISTKKDIEQKDFPEFPKEMSVIMKGVSVVTLKGDPGDPGEPGEPGKDYVLTAKDKKEIAKAVEVPVIEKIIERQPIVTNEIKEVAVGDSPDEVVEKVNTAKKKILWKQIKGVPDFATSDTMNQVGVAAGGGNKITFLSNGVRISEYVTEINFSTNITPTYVGNGRITLTATGGGAGSTTYTETPSGLINGSNKSYTTANAITTVINFAINGQYIHPAEYSIAGSTITFVAALDSTLSGTSFTIVYQ